MTTYTSGKFNFTPEQRQQLAEAYQLIPSWRQKRIRAHQSQPNLRTQVPPAQTAVGPVESEA